MSRVRPHYGNTPSASQGKVAQHGRTFVLLCDDVIELKGDR
jgi:hypothetical protein